MKKYIGLLLAAILVSIAAICKALVDTIAFHKGGVFKGNDFFNINVQGKFLPLTSYPFDAFHLANSAMIFFFILLVITRPKQKWWIVVPVLGVVYILVFNLFWNHIFN